MAVEDAEAPGGGGDRGLREEGEEEVIPYPWDIDWTALAVVTALLGLACLVAFRWRGRIR